MKSILVILFTVSLASPGFAANKKVCNELKRTQCGKREDCTWIKKSKKSERKAYCRSKGKKTKAAEKK